MAVIVVVAAAASMVACLEAVRCFCGCLEVVRCFYGCLEAVRWYGGMVALRRYRGPGTVVIPRYHGSTHQPALVRIYLLSVATYSVRQCCSATVVTGAIIPGFGAMSLEIMVSQTHVACVPPFRD